MRRIANIGWPAAAVLVAACVPSQAEAAFINAGGSVWVIGGTCSPTSSLGFYEETCTDGAGTQAHALASVGPGGVFPSLGALATITSPASAVGAIAEGIASYEDTMSFAAGVATFSFTFHVDGTMSKSGTPGDGPSAYFEFDAPGGFTFQEFGLGLTDAMLSTPDIPITGGTLDYSLLLKALAAAPGGGVQSVDFASTLTIVDVVQRDAAGTRVFTPIGSALGFSYGTSAPPVPEPASGWLLAAGLLCLYRARRGR
jgi:hypothetical protein